MDEINFSVGFDVPSIEAWRSAAQKALGGAPFSALQTTLYEGIATDPLYTAATSAHFAAAAGAPGIAPFIRAALPKESGRPWTIIQFLDHLDIAEANRQLRSDAENGARGFWLQLGGNIPYGGAYLGA